MITQNPITGRSRKKLSGVYARTLYGKNVIQSCPSRSSKPPTAALRENRSLFGLVTAMANQIPQGLLNSIYYSAPTGRSRRHVLAHQLFTGVTREDGVRSFSTGGLQELGTNTLVLLEPVILTPSDVTFNIDVADLDLTVAAHADRVPLIIAVSYTLCVCASLKSYTSLSNGVITVTPIPSTWVGQQLFLYPLFDVNVGTSNNPIYAPGSFNR